MTFGPPRPRCPPSPRGVQTIGRLAVAQGRAFAHRKTEERRSTVVQAVLRQPGITTGELRDALAPLLTHRAVLGWLLDLERVGRVRSVLVSYGRGGRMRRWHPV